MNKLFRYIAVAALAIVGASCTDDAVDDLTGMYEAPQPYAFTSATDMGVTKNGAKRIFAVDFTNTAGDILSLKLVGDVYYLHTASFTPAEESQARKGNYIIGQGGSTFSAAGTQAVALVKGSVSITRGDNDDYAIKGVIWLEDGRVIRVSGSGVLAYKPDPEALALTKVLSVTNNVPNGTPTVTLNLGTDGVVATPNAWGGVDMGGSGNYLAVDFYSADGTLEPGTYSPTASGSEAPFTYVMGWDPGDLWGIGMVFSNWGTCWWTADNGTAEHITEGTFEVKKSGSIYTITYDHNGLFFEFKGEIAGLAESGAQSYDVALTKVLSVTNNVPNGTSTITLNLGTDGIEAVPNAWGGVDMGGNGNYLAIDLYSADGSLAAGTYTATASGSEAPFTYVKGWDPGDLWGIGMVFSNWGTCWWTMVDGQASAQHIESGDVIVDYADGIFTISYAQDGISFQYKGAIEGVTGVGGVSTPSVDYIEISNFLSATPNEGNLLSLQLAGEGLSLAPNAWGGTDISGDGNYLKIDFYSADGTLAEGTYTPADNTAMGEFNFAKGYDPGDVFGWGIEFKNWGTAWMTRQGGAESGVNVVDGTITVEKQGDNYVITLTSSAVNVRYTGPVTL